MAGVVAMLAAAGCSQGVPEAEPEEPPMKVEDTVFGDLVGTQDKARDQTNAAVDVHRAALEAQIEASEGSKPGDSKPED
jgi:hypothetical protein